MMLIPECGPYTKRPIDPLVRMSAVTLCALGHSYLQDASDWGGNADSDDPISAFRIVDDGGSDCDDGPYLDVLTVTPDQCIYHSVIPSSPYSTFALNQALDQLMKDPRGLQSKVVSLITHPDGEMENWQAHG